MSTDQPTILVIFGISGDLAGRYLLPAISAISKAKMLPKKFHIVGVTRNLDKAYLKKHLDKKTEMLEMDLGKASEYEKLKKIILSARKKFKSELDPQILFYLSVPPNASEKIVEMLGKSGLSKIKNAKLLLEKPFGSDLSSAEHLVRHIEEYFAEEQIYRIDHYLAKEAAQNIIVFRNGNSLFKKTWNSNFIESIDILASEKIGIEGRAKFYEQTGALRDYVQSHLLQLAALILMDLPDQCGMDAVPALRLKALKGLKIACGDGGSKCVKRGQYAGYRSDAGNPKSTVETFVSIQLKSSDPKWKGVPITVATGKAMAERFTEIRIRYKKTKEQEANELIFRLQPNPGIEFSVFAKKPGYERELSEHTLHFNFNEHYTKLPEAYEQVLWSAINSDHSLFTGSAEVLESWRIVDIIQRAWKGKSADLTIYKKGSKI